LAKFKQKQLSGQAQAVVIPFLSFVSTVDAQMGRGRSEPAKRLRVSPMTQ
jgi:hypothetical protein